MAVYDTYSKRLKRERGEMPDVYQYDQIPNKFRVQVCHVMKDVLGTEDIRHETEVVSLYRSLVDSLTRELGVFELPSNKIKEDKYYGETDRNHVHELIYYMLEVPRVEDYLTALEQVCIAIQCVAGTSHLGRYHADNTKISNDAINEINIRFQENGFGYRFENGQIIRIDDEHIHQSVTKPALKILQAPEYRNANDEYMKAFDHYKHQRRSECLNECLKAFESVMKVICAKRGWQHAPQATANNLVQVCIKNGLVSSMLDTKMNSLISLLSSSVPTIRNAKGGHGGGTEKVDVPQHLARYVLDMTGAAIVFLANSDAELSQ